MLSLASFLHLEWKVQCQNIWRVVCLLPSSACSQREGGWELGSADASAPLSPRGSQTRTLRADKQKYSADSQELGAQQRKVHVLQVRPTHG